MTYEEGPTPEITLVRPASLTHPLLRFPFSSLGRAVLMSVDILGRQKLNELVLRVAAGDGDAIQENIESEIVNISERVKIYDD